MYTRHSVACIFESPAKVDVLTALAAFNLLFMFPGGNQRVIVVIVAHVPAVAFY